MINLLKIIVLLSVSFCYDCVEQIDEIVDDDSIIIDAPSTSLRSSASFEGASPESVIRNGRQIYLTNLPSASWIQSTIRGEGSPCVTSKGHIGACTSFRNCYPYFKLPDLTLWDAWILGNYDRCSFLSDKGQAFGVCCSNPITTTTASPETDDAESDYNIDGGGGDGDGDDDNNNNFNDDEDHDNGGNNNSNSAEYPSDNRYSSWPPPFITHPPDHTAATHPPLSGYPPAGAGRPPAIRPTTTTTTRRPPTQWPTKPSKPSTTYPGWPPTTTTKKPITAGWPSRPTKPTTSTQYPGWPPTSTLPAATTTTESSVITGDASCGAKNGYQDQERIVGGTNADPNEWPWIAVLFNGGRQFCGGSLVSNIHILTAAHCVAHFTSWDVARLTVRLGDHNIKTDNEVKHIEKRIKRVVRHRGFDSRTLYNDVAVLTMESPVQFTRTIRPLCLPNAGTRQLYNGKTGTVIGWGSLAENGPQPAILQKVSIPIWSNTECRQKYGSAAPGGIVESMVCAGRATKDSCSGDSGGPLMVNEGRWTQVGIVSWGIGCGKGQYPGVYTRVTHFMPWITKNMKEQKKSIIR